MDKLFLLALVGELERRRQRNPQYSMRAFAKSIGISPSRFSEVMSGKGKIAPATIKSILQKLNWDDSFLFVSNEKTSKSGPLSSLLKGRPLNIQSDPDLSLWSSTQLASRIGKRNMILTTIMPHHVAEFQSGVEQLLVRLQQVSASELTASSGIPVCLDIQLFPIKIS